MSGDAIGVKFAVAPFSRAGVAAAVSSGRTAQSIACHVDKERDMVAPAVLQLTNENASLQQKVAVFLGRINHDALAPVKLEASIYFSSGARCKSLDISATGTSAIGSTNALAPRGFVEFEMYFVLHDFITPKAPIGDVPVLAKARLGISPWSDNATEWRAVSLEGPGEKNGGEFNLPLTPLAPLTG